MMYCDKSLLEQIKGQTDNRSSFVIKEICRGKNDIVKNTNIFLIF